MLQELTSVQRKELGDDICKILWEGITGRKYRRLRVHIGNIEHRDKDGKLLWQDRDGANALVDQGEEYFLKVGLGGATMAATTYLGLSQSNEATLGETITLAGINEVAGTGYARGSITSNLTDWTASLNSGDWQMLSKQITFTATGGTWSAALSLFLATSADGSGKVLSTKDLSMSRTLASGDTLKCTLTLKLS
jgi:hypothetical protein